MNVTLLSLAVIFALLGSTASASKDLLFLTPMNAEHYGYWVRCVVKDKAHSREEPGQRTRHSEPALVIFRLGLIHNGRLHKRPFAVDRKDLQIIKSITLVVRDGEAVLLNVPLRTEVDPGNYIHLLAKFSAQTEMVSKMNVLFQEHGKSEKKTVAIDLKAFIAKP